MEKETVENRPPLKPPTHTVEVKSESNVTVVTVKVEYKDDDEVIVLE